jgi:hypothetical protein
MRARRKHQQIGAGKSETAKWDTRNDRADVEERNGANAQKGWHCEMIDFTTKQRGRARTDPRANANRKGRSSRYRLQSKYDGKRY